MFGQCMAVVAKGNRSLFKACPKHFFFFLIWISSTLRVTSVSAREQSFRTRNTAQLHSDLYIPSSGGKKYQQCSVLTVKSLQKQLAFSAWTHVPSVSVHPRITTAPSERSTEFATYCSIKTRPRQLIFQPYEHICLRLCCSSRLADSCTAALGKAI